MDRQGKQTGRKTENVQKDRGHEGSQSDSHTGRKAGLETGRVCRLNKDRNRTDRQAGISAHCQRDRRLGTGKVGRQARRQKTDRQAGGRQTDGQKGNGETDRVGKAGRYT